MLDKAMNTLLTDPKTLIGGAILALIAVIVIGRKVRKAKAGKIADKLVGPVMFAGMIWSADAVWVLTGPDHLGLPTPLRIAMFAVLEFALLVAMLRAKDSMDRIGHTGFHGGTAWLIASGIAAFGFILGFYEGGLVVAAFRPLIPLMLTKLWWDGVLGDSPRKAGKFKWTPRNLLIAMGAIEADERDVQTVNRDRLIDQMVSLHRQWTNAKGDRKSRAEAKLARVSEKADEEIIAEVRRKRGMSNWFTVTQLVAHEPAPGLTHDATHSDAPAYAPRNAAVEVPPARRAKQRTQAVTSDYAPAEDPGTQAALYALAHREEVSNRQAAEKFGVSDGTVRNRIKDLRKLPEFAHLADADTEQPINGHELTNATK